MSTNRKTGLVVLYNHHFERNIPLIRELYRHNFSEMRQIMPFYRPDQQGTEGQTENQDVLSVFGNSFLFHSYIAQVRSHLMEMKCDDILIIGDDLLLNPSITEDNLHDKLQIPPGHFYIDGVVNICDGEYYRPVQEAHRFSPHPPGLDGSANRWVPPYDEAFNILHKKGLMTHTILNSYHPFFPLWQEPLLSLSNLHANYKIFKARVYHTLAALKYRLFPKRFSYPCVFGYSDILLIPKEKLDLFCRYMEVFATWGMFVELAIPTALMLMPDCHVSHASGHDLKTGNVWYPQNPKHFKNINDLIQKTIAASEGRLDKLGDAFPQDYLYLHPVKLSQLNF